MATRDAGNGPVLGTPYDFPDRPQRRGRLVAHAVIGALIAIIMGGWGYVMWLASGDAGVPSRVITFHVRSAEEAEITFILSKPDERIARCRLQALDSNHAEVGGKDVTIPAGGGMNQLKESLRTSARASSVHVQYCTLV